MAEYAGEDEPANGVHAAGMAAEDKVEVERRREARSTAPAPAPALHAVLYRMIATVLFPDHASRASGEPLARADQRSPSLTTVPSSGKLPDRPGAASSSGLAGVLLSACCSRRLREAYDQVREMCIFLLNGLALPPDKALAVYVQSPGSPFVYCGAVTVSRPSAVLPLPWPEPGGDTAVAGSAGGQPLQLTSPGAAPLSAKIGVSVEDLGALPSLDAAAGRRIERMAMRVGENLFNFMQSFCGVDGSKLVVPTDILDRWFIKFQERAKRDPEYLKGFAL